MSGFLHSGVCLPPHVRKKYTYVLCGVNKFGCYGKRSQRERRHRSPKGGGGPRRRAFEAGLHGLVLGSQLNLRGPSAECLWTARSVFILLCVTRSAFALTDKSFFLTQSNTWRPASLDPRSSHGNDRRYRTGEHDPTQDATKTIVHLFTLHRSIGNPSPVLVRRKSFTSSQGMSLQRPLTGPVATREALTSARSAFPHDERTEDTTAAGRRGWGRGRRPEEGEGAERPWSVRYHQSTRRPMEKTTVRSRHAHAIAADSHSIGCLRETPRTHGVGSQMSPAPSRGYRSGGKPRRRRPERRWTRQRHRSRNGGSTGAPCPRLNVRF